MKVEIILVEREDQEDHLAKIVEGVNARLHDRGCIGDLDAMEASWSLCLHETIADLGGIVLAQTIDRVVVDMAHAPDQIRELVTT